MRERKWSRSVDRFVIAFLPRSKHLLISWLQSLSTVILESTYMKSHTISTFSPPICHEVIGPDIMTSVFWMLSFKPAAFSLSSFTLINRQAVKHSQKKKKFLPKITAKAREMKRKKKECSCNEWSVIFSYRSHLVGFYSWLLPSSLCSFRHIPSLWEKKTLLITFLLPLVEQTRGKPSDPHVMNVGYRFERDRDGFPARKVKWLHPFPFEVVLIQPGKFCKWQSHLSIEF